MYWFFYQNVGFSICVIASSSAFCSLKNPTLVLTWWRNLQFLRQVALCLISLSPHSCKTQVRLQYTQRQLQRLSSVCAYSARYNGAAKVAGFFRLIFFSCCDVISPQFDLLLIDYFALISSSLLYLCRFTNCF